MFSLLLCCSLLGGDPNPQPKPYWGMGLGVLNDKSRPALANMAGRPCPATVGAIVVRVDKDGPAEKAGLKVTDVILKIGKQSMTDAKTSQDVFLASKPEEELELTVLNAGPKPVDDTHAASGNRKAGQPQIVWTRKTVKLVVGTKPAEKPKSEK